VTGGPVLGVDPGTRKVGYAILAPDGSVLDQGIAPNDGLSARFAALAATYGLAAVALGHGTNVRPVRVALEGLGLPIALVDERETTLRARELYFADHPPRGWRRLIPRSLQLPPRPIDDYAAILIGRRYLGSGSPGRGTSYLLGPE
jgi:RNase H-fold protein (predicted Holliday junction resolvase)